jgi:tRNA pseudouridine32 synthase/23S rRNA pseudouridine746 synthase
VNWQRGKPSQTKFEVLGREGNHSRVAFYPLTGRTHQLRVHAAHPQGLNAPIWGDRLYGDGASGDESRGDGSRGDRLHLHAHRLSFAHPHRAEGITLESAVPF